MIVHIMLYTWTVGVINVYVMYPCFSNTIICTFAMLTCLPLCKEVFLYSELSRLFSVFLDKRFVDLVFFVVLQ